MMFGKQINCLIECFRQKGRAESDATLFLTKSRCWYNTDSRFFQKTQRIQIIWCGAEFLGLIDGTLWNLDSGERVHGTLSRLASNAINFVKSLYQFA